jgi:hypothetical protein
MRCGNRKAEGRPETVAACNQIYVRRPFVWMVKVDQSDLTRAISSLDRAAR